MPNELHHAQLAQASSLFRDDYEFRVRRLDFDSTEMKRAKEEARREQEAVSERKVANADALNKVCAV